MRALLQRTTGALVRVEGEVLGEMGTGLVVFLGVGPADDEAVTDALARRLVDLRLFQDEEGRTNRSLGFAHSWNCCWIVIPTTSVRNVTKLLAEWLHITTWWS